MINSGVAKLSIIETQLQADGSMLWLETNKIPLRNLNNEVIGVLGTYQDITSRKRAEITLRESEKFNRQLITEFPIGLARCRMELILFLDFSKKIYSVNTGLMSSIGYQKKSQKHEQG